MSLLMDALKKAEEEKKKAAKRLEEVEAGTGSRADDSLEKNFDESGNDDLENTDKFKNTAQLSLEPLISTKPEENKVDGPKVDGPKVDGPKVDEPKVDEPKVDEPVVEAVDVNETDKPQESQRETPTVDATGTYSDNLTLEDTVTSDALEETQHDIDLSDTTIIEGLSTEDVSAPFDDTFHGVLLDDDLQSEVYEETLPGIPADQLANDLNQSGGYQTTPVAAQTVFSAGNVGKQNNTFRWGVFFMLVILAVSSFAIFYYFTITPVTRKIPSPLVARGIEVTPESAPMITPMTEPDVVSGTIISPETTVVDETITQVETEIKEVMDEPVVNEELVRDEEVVGTEEAESGVDIDTDIIEVDIVSDDEKEKTVPEELAQVSKESVVVGDTEQSVSTEPQEIIQGNISLVEISKSKLIEKQDSYVQEAFKAYKAGHFNAARSLYQDVLKKAPDNRDAHLGLAAMAVNDNDLATAYKHYIHVLDINPKDAIALNALIAISNNSDPVADESAIKLLLQQEGDIPYLYFSLGNIYAKQQRWPEAQRAFFEAYRLDSSNPDYVYNMAISLDRLGQYSTALDYYKTAIDLIQHSPAKFDITIVKRRINILNNIKKTSS